MVEFTKNFTTSIPDDTGRYVVGDDHVTLVKYYVVGEPDWRVDYDQLTNPFWNADFSGPTITGTGRFDGGGSGWYETGWDAASLETDRYFNVGKIPFYWEEDLFAAYATVLSSTPAQDGSVNSVAGDYFINASAQAIPKNVFPSKYLDGIDTSDPYATTSGIPGGLDAHITFDFGDDLQEVAGFFIDSFNSVGVGGTTAAAAVVGEYEIQVAVSGTGLDDGDYTTLVSGTNHEAAPIWVDAVPTTAKYVRLIYRNRGSSVRTGLTKFWAFSQETIDKGFSLFLMDVKDHDTVGGGGRLININQDVNFGGLDYVYVDDFKVFSSRSASACLGSTAVGGSTQWDFINQYRFELGSTGDEFLWMHGLSLDVSAYGHSTFTLTHQFTQVPFANDRSLSAFAGVSVVPGWFSEGASAKRGTKTQFPDEVLFVVDKKGLSIIDVSKVPGENEVVPRLWMRFDLSEQKMLQMRPRDVAFRAGKLYLATSRGLYVIDFPANKSVRFTELGPYVRFGIDYRNVNQYLGSLTSSSVTPHRSYHTYIRFWDSPQIPELDIYSVDAGYDSVYGSFVVLGTADGLVVFNGALDDGALFYQSKDRRPVRHVRVVGSSVWYSQGDGAATNVGFIEDINSAVTADFVPDRVVHSNQDFSDSLSGAVGGDRWSIVSQDPGMGLSSSVNGLTISGSHTQGGATGLISREFVANRSFVAKVRVRIEEFPPDARGAVRFGFAHDYLDEGIRSLYSYGDGAYSGRQGFFLSALNIDPIGGHPIEDTSFTTGSWGDARGWFVTGARRSSGSGDGDMSFFTPTVSGAHVAALGFDKFSGDQALNRVVSSWPFNRRKFTARVDVQLAEGFNPYSGYDQHDNAAAWLGFGNKSDMFPGTTGTGDYINAAMVVSAWTTFSGVPFYTVGRFDSNAWISDFVTTHGSVIPALPTESTGETTSPFREWRIDFDPYSGNVDAFLDGTYINTIKVDHNPQPPVHGLTFGVYGRSDHGTDPPERRAYFRNLRLTYPSLNPASSYKYALEYVDEDGGVYANLVPYTTASGLSLNPDNTPASGTLGSSPTLTDGNLHSGGNSFGQYVSLGVALSGTSTVEALYVYDTAPTTGGWSSAASKLVELWSSDDNFNWTLIDELDLHHMGRSDGVTKLPLEPAVDGKFFKIRGVSATGNYLVGGGGAWLPSEIQAITVSGVGFSVTDATVSAGYREWMLDYNADSREIRGYVDGSLVSIGSVPYDMEQGKFVLVHDLVPVNSGTGTTFYGQFKDFEVTFAGDSLIVGGDLDTLYVGSKALSATNTEYSVVTGSVGGAAYAKVEVGVAPASDSVEFFSHVDDLFGDSLRTYALFADSATTINSGLVFFGTGSVTRTPTYLARYTRPRWLAGVLDPGFGDEVRYGGLLGIGYHPGLDKMLQFMGTHAHYMAVVDFEQGKWDQLTQEYNWRAAGKSRTSSPLGGQPKLTYAVYTDEMLYFSGNIIAGVSIADGATSRYAQPDTIGRWDVGKWFLTYVAHDHTIVHGQDYISRTDVKTGAILDHPRWWGGSNHRWNRFRSAPPFGGDFGHAQAVYCDYDKSVYFFAQTSSDIHGDRYVYRYDPDKDWLETISNQDIESLGWPVDDANLYDIAPLFLGGVNSSTPVYDPVLKRIYVFGAFNTHPQMYYYDVVQQEWGDPGEQPPYIARREWEGTPSDNSVSFAVYRSRNDSFVVYGGDSDPNMVEYFPERHDYAVKFDYVPSRDGLPTSSGTSRHFTVNKSTLLPVYSDSDAFNRDFYRVPVYDQTRVDFILGSEYITVSGLDISEDTDARRDREFYVSTEKYESDCSFDLTAKVAFPRWERAVYHSSSNTDGVNRAEAHFALGLQDGLNRVWADSSYGQEDPNLFQVVEVRAGVQGPIASTAEQPFVGHFLYEDGQNNDVGGTTAHATQVTYHTYDSGGLDLGTESPTFHDLKLSYDADSSLAEAFVDGVSVGSTTMRRKFDPNGVRVCMGMYLHVDNALTYPAEFVAQVKNLKLTPKAWDRIENGRLITSISGSTGAYYHERWDTTLTSGVGWVYETEVYLPTSRKFSGFDYVATLAAVGDGRKLCELAAIVGPARKKQVAITGDLDSRGDRNSYLAVVDHIWDDVDIGNYRLEKSTASGTVSVFVGDLSTPVLEVAYDALPEYRNQHVYYGKVNYGNFESVLGPTVVSGTWNNNPNFSGSFDPTPGKRRWKGSSTYAKFATINQTSPLAVCSYDLDPDVGTVDLYAFYLVTYQDSAYDVPHTVVASGIVSLPPIGGAVSSVLTGVDYLGNSDPNSTTVLVDQQLTFDGSTVNGFNSDWMDSSGWVYLGRYINPTKVYVTADAEDPGTSTVIPFVCAGALGVDVGKRSKSTFDMSVNYVRYHVGGTELPEVPFEPSGVTVVDMSEKQRIDFYGKQTAPALPGSSITSGDKFEE